MANEHQQNPPGKETFFYFVDGTKFESAEPHTTGATIKANLPESKRGYALYLEGHGNQSDVLINDDTSVDLKVPPKHFYTVPPASFGFA